MKIVHIAPMRSDVASGVSIYVLELIKALVNVPDCDVCLLSVLPANIFDEKNVPPGCLFVQGPLSYHKNPWFIDSKWLDKIEKQFGCPDIVHFHDVYSPFESALARQCFKRGWKYVVSVHGGLQDASQSRKIVKKIIGNILFFNSFICSAKSVHVLNEAEERSVKKRYPSVKTFIVSNSVSAEILSISESLRSHSFSVDNYETVKIGFIGRIDVEHKGVDLLLKAVRLLEIYYPEIKLQFFIVGPFHTKKDEKICRNLLSLLKDSSRVVFTGFLKGEEKWKMLSRFDVFIHTSRHEGMPGSVIEAMAFAKPCLVTPGTNMQKIIAEHKAGWCCEANPESIARKIYYVSRSREEIIKRGMNAREYVVQHLTRDKAVEEYVRCMKAIL